MTKFATTFCLSSLMLIGCAPASPSNNGSGSTPDQASKSSQDAPQKATAGVGQQGQSLNDESGVGRIVAQPAITLFKVKQKVVFEIQIPQALNLYKAMEGTFPKSHDEFMNKIIKQNQIQLPELPEGQIYKFNTEKGELWVYPEGE